MSNRITLSPNAGSEEIKLAILRVLQTCDRAMTACEIAEAIDHVPDDGKRIKNKVYNLEKNAKATIKGKGSPKKYTITKYGNRYLEAHNDYAPSAGQPATPPPVTTEKKRLYVPYDIYKLGLNPQEFALYVWGRTQSENFKFSDKGAATMLHCHPNTIRNIRLALMAKKLLYVKQNRQGGKFGSSKWIFFEKPTAPQEVRQQEVQNNNKPSEPSHQKETSSLPF